MIARFLDLLHEKRELNFDNVGMVGVSLGAHILGQTGKQVLEGKIDTMFGLDPAGKLKITFIFNSKAQFVIVQVPCSVWTTPIID